MYDFAQSLLNFLTYDENFPQFLLISVKTHYYRTVPQDGYMFEGLNILISGTYCICADGFQCLSKAFHYPIQLLTYFTSLHLLPDTILRIPFSVISRCSLMLNWSFHFADNNLFPDDTHSRINIPALIWFGTLQTQKIEHSSTHSVICVTFSKRYLLLLMTFPSMSVLSLI